jgi:hypothetical protein
VATTIVNRCYEKPDHSTPHNTTHEVNNALERHDADFTGLTLRELLAADP